MQNPCIDSHKATKVDWNTTLVKMPIVCTDFLLVEQNLSIREPVAVIGKLTQPYPVGLFMVLLAIWTSFSKQHFFAEDNGFIGKGELFGCLNEFLQFEMTPECVRTM